MKAALSWMFLSLMLALPPARADEPPIEVALCTAMADPGAWNHKLIRVSGEVSRGFEDFSIKDDSCKGRQYIWLELGGTKNSSVVYCCGDHGNMKRRKAPLVVEGISTTLVEDEVFGRFDKLTNVSGRYGRAKVDLVGRFFSGEREVTPNGVFWGGYGHMGIGSLLVIQQVYSAE